MILEIDAGNTFIKWRLLDGDNVTSRGKLFTGDKDWKLPSAWKEASSARIASVAGDELNCKLDAEVQKCCGESPVFAAATRQTAGVVNSYDDHSRMGVDRWLVMLAAYNDCNKACCIVDCGSAITVDYVAADGQHQGGYIIPGLRLMRGTLLQNTAEIIVDKDLEGFDLTPGNDTSSAVTHGVNYLFDSLVDSLILFLIESSLFFL